jgi:hypothetical protein
MHQNFEGLSILTLLELVQIKKSVLVKRTGLPVRGGKNETDNYFFDFFYPFILSDRKSGGLLKS